MLQMRDLPAMNTTSIIEPRPLTLPPIGHDIISRPSSTSSSQSHHSSPALQLPALSALANLATSASSLPSITRTLNFVNQDMSYIAVQTPTPTPTCTVAPATATGAVPNGIPACANCGTNTTPLWRRDESGSVLCNACGLFLKLHGRPRPISLKTDVIKSRNRVKAGQGIKRPRTETTSLAASHPDADPAQAAALAERRASQQAQANGPDRSISPISRSGTPGLHNPNIAPQHLFDGVTLGSENPYGAPLPPFPRHPSPSCLSVNGSHLVPTDTYDAILALNTTLKTRVSELELINDLFRTRVQELENSQQQAQKNESMAREAELRAREDLEAALAREAELRRRLEDLGVDLSDLGSATKRLRMSDMLDVDGGRAGTPLSTTLSHA